jgi:hypothetical protein
MDAKGGFSIGMGDRTDITEINREVDNPGPAKYRLRKELLTLEKGSTYISLTTFLFR